MINFIKKKLLLLLLLIFLMPQLFGQNSLNDLNYKKYWWYRYRLVNDFLVIGDCQGCSLPMAQRAAPKVSNNSLIIDARWGDNTINLGHYISVLATEYELLKRAGQPTDPTVRELYYAIQAVNRLDKNAEAGINCRGCYPLVPSSTDMNGFFIKDDVYSDFLEDHQSLKIGLVTGKPVHDVRSDFSNAGTTDLESQDQIWPIFMGLALVTKYVDDWVSYNGVNLKLAGINTATRILGRIKDHTWRIKNPVTETFISDDDGGNVLQFAYGASEAACFIRNGNLTLNFGVPLHTCDDYILDPAVKTTADIWNAYGKGIGNALLLFADEDWKILYLAAIGNSWWNDVNPFFPNPVETLAIILNPYYLINPAQGATALANQLLPVPPVNQTSVELGARAFAEHYEHLALLRQDLHGGSNPISVVTYNNLINSAPCEGPWCYNYPSNTALSPSGSAAYEWSTSSRLTKPDERGGEGHAFNNYGEYNGLDYMLYYNLFALSQGTTGPGVSYSNYINKAVTISFPHTELEITVGIPSHTAYIEAFNSIEANNIVNSNAAAIYRGGKEVHLSPGFHAIAGSQFHAYVDPFHCAAGGEYRAAAVNNDSSSDNNMQSAVAYAGPTTFAKHTPEKTQPIEEKSETTTLISQSKTTVSPEQKTISPTVSTVKESKVQILPNPNNGSFEVIISNKEIINVKLTVLNIVGNPILEQQLNGPITRVDISNNAKGIYYVKIEDENGIKMEKIIYQ
jgi:hypothetical protein